MSPVASLFVHLVAGLWVFWSVVALVRLCRDNAAMAADNARLTASEARMAAAVIEATSALNSQADRTEALVRRTQRARDTALRGLPAVVFGDAEGRN